MPDKVNTWPVFPCVMKIFQNKPNRHVIEHSCTKYPWANIVNVMPSTVFWDSTTNTSFHHTFSHNTWRCAHHAKIITNMNTMPIGRHEHRYWMSTNNHLSTDFSWTVLFLTRLDAILYVYRHMLPSNTEHSYSNSVKLPWQ